MFNLEGKGRVNDMLYRNKEAFSLRDGIGTCPTRDRSRCS